MLSFQIINDGLGIQIACDDEGVSALIAVLEKLRGTATHVHLRSPANGGKLLSDQTPWGEATVGEVIITTGGD